MKNTVPSAPGEYIASAIARFHLSEMGIDKKMSPEEIEESIQARGKSITGFSDINSEVIVAMAFAGYLNSRQAYKFSKGLIMDLEASDKMGFRFNDLHLPFDSMFLDFEGHGIVVDGKDASGAFIRNIEPSDLAYVFLLRGKDGGFSLLAGCMDYGTDKTLEEQITETSGGFDGEGRFYRIVFSCLAYLSSEKPDVVDAGKKISVRKANRKKEVSVNRFWNVGFRYMVERTGRTSSETEETIVHGTHASPRPHMRRGHWHTYRCGPGRKETRIRWLNPMMVGNGNVVDVIRKKEEP